MSETSLCILRLRPRLLETSLKIWDWDFRNQSQILRLRLRLYASGLKAWDRDWDHPGLSLGLETKVSLISVLDQAYLRDHEGNLETKYEVQSKYYTDHKSLSIILRDVTKKQWDAPRQQILKYSQQHETLCNHTLNNGTEPNMKWQSDQWYFNKKL